MLGDGGTKANCKIICVDTYGITPSMNTEKFENAPPAKKSI